MSDPNQQLLQQVGEVQGQLKLMTQMIQQNHESTHQRINDFRQSIEGRIDGVEVRIGAVEKRVETIDQHERSKSLRGAGGGAVAAAIVTGAIEAIRMLVHK